MLGGKTKNRRGRKVVYNTTYDELVNVMTQVSTSAFSPDEGAQKYLKAFLCALEDSEKAEVFRSDFCLLLINVASDTSNAVSKCLVCVVRFLLLLMLPESSEISNRHGPDTMIESVFSTALKYFEARSSELRYNCVNLLGKILLAIPDAVCDNVLNEKMIDDLSIGLIERVDDREVRTRIEAIRALKRLQNCDDPECSVVLKLAGAMMHDPSPSVRKTALETVVINKRTFPYVFLKTKDVSHTVRREAVMILAKKVRFKSLSRSKRDELLNSVFLDRNEGVRYAAKHHLLPAWLQEFNSDPIALLHHLNLSNAGTKSRNAAERLIEMYVDIAQSDAVMRPFIPYLTIVKEVSVPSISVDMTPPAAEASEQEPEELSAILILDRASLSTPLTFYWKSIMKLNPNELPSGTDVSGGRINFTRPTLTVFTKFLRTFFDTLVPFEKENEVIGNLLLEMGKTFSDSGDEFGRRELRVFLKEMILKDTFWDNFLEQAVSLFFTQYPKSQFPLVTEELMKLIPEIFARRVSVNLPNLLSEKNIEDVMEKKRELRLQHCHLTVRCNVLQNQLEECIAKKEFLKADQTQQAIVEVKEGLKGLEEQIEDLKKQLEVSDVDDRCGDLGDVELALQQQDQRTLQVTLRLVRFILREEFPASLFYQRIPAAQRLGSIPQFSESYALSGIRNSDPSIREDAFSCLGYFSFRSLDNARKHFEVFAHAMRIDVHAIRLVCTSIIGDFFLYYGPSSFGEVGTAAFEYLRSFLTLEKAVAESEALEVITQILCKLFLTGRYASSSTLLDLLFLFYHPELQSHAAFIDVVDRFLPPFACSQLAHQMELASVIVPLLKRLLPFSVSNNEVVLDCRRISQDLIYLIGEESLRNVPADLVPNSLHTFVARSILEGVLQNPDDDQLSDHLLWMLDLINVSQESEDLFDLRDALFAVMSNDEDAKVIKIFEFFRRIEDKGGSYQRVLQEYRKKGLLESAETSESSDPSAVASEFTLSSSVSNEEGFKKGRFFGRYKEVVERHRGHERGRNSHLYEWGILSPALSYSSNSSTTRKLRERLPTVYATDELSDSD